MKASSQIALLAAISKVQSAFILDSDSVTAFQQLLNSLLELTASEYGFIGEIPVQELHIGQVRQISAMTRNQAVDHTHPMASAHEFLGEV